MNRKMSFQTSDYDDAVYRAESSPEVTLYDH